MDDPKKAQEAYQQASGKAVEALTIWSEANHRVFYELVELGTAAAKESVKLYAEVQQSALDALREGQAATLRWQAAWQDGAKDPMAWCQKAVVGGVERAHETFRLLEGNAQAITRTAERLQASTEQAGKGIQEAFTTVVTKMKDVYSQN